MPFTSLVSLLYNSSKELNLIKIIGIFSENTRMLHLFTSYIFICVFVGFNTEKKRFLFNQGRRISHKFNSVWDKKSLAGLITSERKALFLAHRQIFDLTFSIFVTNLSTFLYVIFFLIFHRNSHQASAQSNKFKCFIPCSCVGMSLCYTW